MRNRHPMADPEATPQARKSYVDELEMIYKDIGSLDPEDVVEWARAHPSSALYGRFQWDDTRAAHLYRLQQARHVITEVIAVYPDGKRHQVYVSPIEERREIGYSTLVEVLSDSERRANFLAQALDEYQRLGEKYAELKELAKVRAEVARVKGGRKGRRRAA